jgi:hypothetical protein
LHGLFFDPEDGSDMCLRNIVWLLPDYTALHSRRHTFYLQLLCVVFSASSVGFALVLRLGFWGFVKFLLYVIFVDCIGVGLLIATLFW